MPPAGSAADRNADCQYGSVSPRSTRTRHRRRQYGRRAAAYGRGDRFAFADAAFIVRCCDGSLDVLRRFVEAERD